MSGRRASVRYRQSRRRGHARRTASSRTRRSSTGRPGSFRRGRGQRRGRRGTSPACASLCRAFCLSGSRRCKIFIEVSEQRCEAKGAKRKGRNEKRKAELKRSERSRSAKGASTYPIINAAARTRRTRPPSLLAGAAMRTPTRVDARTDRKSASAAGGTNAVGISDRRLRSASMIRGHFRAGRP